MNEYEKNDNKRANTILLISAVVLLILGFIANDPFGLTEERYEDASLILPKTIKNNIKEIVVSNNGKEVLRLTKSNSLWNVGENKETYPANQSKTENSIRKLYSLSRFNEISTSKKKHADFKVTENNLFLNIIDESDKSIKLFIGKQGSTFNTTLVRRGDEDTVYSVKNNLQNEWNQKTDYFRDRKIVAFAKQDVKEIIFNGKLKYTLASNVDKKWVLISKNKTFDTNAQKIDQLFQTIESLEGTEFFKESNLGTPYATIAINQKNNLGEVIELRKVNGKIYIVKSKHNPYWIIIPEFKITGLLNPISDLKIPSKK